MMAGNDCYWQKGHRSHSSCHHTHTHTHLTALYLGLTNLDFTEATDREWQWLGYMQA